MLTVGIRELKQHTSKLLRRVREDGVSIEITYHGNVVARLVPVSPPAAGKDMEAVWADLDQLTAEIGARWPAGTAGDGGIVRSGIGKATGDGR